MTYREIATALNLSPARIAQMVKKGMPTTSSAAAKSWRWANCDHGKMNAGQGSKFRRAGRAVRVPVPPADVLLAPAGWDPDEVDWDALEDRVRVSLNAWLAAAGLPPLDAPACVKFLNRLYTDLGGK